MISISWRHDFVLPRSAHVFFKNQQFFYAGVWGADRSSYTRNYIHSNGNNMIKKREKGKRKGKKVEGKEREIKLIENKCDSKLP